MKSMIHIAALVAVLFVSLAITPSAASARATCKVSISRISAPTVYPSGNPSSPYHGVTAVLTPQECGSITIFILTDGFNANPVVGPVNVASWPSILNFGFGTAAQDSLSWTFLWPDPELIGHVR